MSQLITDLAKVGIRPPAPVVAAFALRASVSAYCSTPDRAEAELGAAIESGELTPATVAKAVQSALRPA